jgi:hypothetical protein
MQPKTVKETMLTDKQIEEVSKAAADIAVSLDMHPCLWVNFVVGSMPCTWDERKSEMRKCQQWLFDNQQAYPFSITKEDMLY